MSFNIENEYGEIKILDYEKIICDVIQQALIFIKCPYECEINVVLTDNAIIREINKSQRNIDSATDVLSFPMLSYEVPGDFSHVEDGYFDDFNSETGELLLGDIVISMDRVYEQAEAYNHANTRELAFLVAHSMLHLFGYDHMEEDERIEMEGLQEQILDMKGFTRDYEEN